MDRTNLGIQLRLLSGVFATGMAICVKSLPAVPLGEIVFFRSLFALIPLTVFLWLRNEFPSGLRTRRPFGHLFRSALGAAGMFASFATIARLPVAEATLISYLSPPFTAVLAAIFLREVLTPMRIAALVLGLAGVAVLVAPDLAGATWDGTRVTGYALGVLTASLVASALVMVRNLALSESPGAIAFYFAVASMVGGLATLPSGWTVPDGREMALLVGSGLFGGLAHIAMTLAFRHAEASRLAPLDYVSLLWVVLADMLIFGSRLAATFLPALALLLIGAALPMIEARQIRRRSRSCVDSTAPGQSCGRSQIKSASARPAAARGTASGPTTTEPPP